MKKHVWIVCFILMFVFVVSGCGPAATQGTGVPGETTNNASENEGINNNLTITLIHRYIDANVGIHSEDTAILSMLKKYKEDNPGIEIVEEQLQNHEYMTKAQTLAAANDLPDVFTTTGAWLPNFVNNGLLADIKPNLEERSEWYNGYRKGTFDLATIDGKIYGTPMASGPTSVIFYNSEMFSDIGYDVFPKTWDEMMDAFEKIKEKGIIPMSCGNKGRTHALSAWMSVLVDRVTGPEWTEGMNAKTGGKFTDPEIIRTFTLFSDMVSAGYVNKDVNSIDTVISKSYYYEGEAAAFIDGIWSVVDVVDNASEELLKVTQVAVLPAIEGGKGNPLTSAGGAGVYYSLNSDIKLGTPKRDATVELLQYLTGDGSAKIMAEIGGFPAYDPGDFDRTGLHRLAVEAYDLGTAAEQCRIWDLWFDAAVVEEMCNNFQGLFAGALTPEEVAQNLQDEYDTYLERSKN